jgi:predicted dehydrogenase
MPEFRWGILGCGKIAHSWAHDLEHVPGARLQAVWARDPAKASVFARDHGAVRFAGSVTQLLDAGDLDAVYVATPHGRHRDDALACLERGLPVLCEKAFALDLDQARQMVDAARSRGVFLMEALWTRFLPGFRAALELAGEGRLGVVRSVRSDFGFLAPYREESRLWDPAMGGGALLDIGIYPLFFALAFLGPVESFDLQWTPAPNGTDRSLRIRALHREGGRSESLATFDENTLCKTRIQGDQASIEFAPMFHTATDVAVETSGGSWVLPASVPGTGYQFETLHVQECLANGWIQSPLWPLSRTLELMDLLTRIRERMRP